MVGPFMGRISVVFGRWWGSREPGLQPRRIQGYGNTVQRCPLRYPQVSREDEERSDDRVVDEYVCDEAPHGEGVERRKEGGIGQEARANPCVYELGQEADSPNKCERARQREVLYQSPKHGVDVVGLAIDEHLVRVKALSSRAQASEVKQPCKRVTTPGWMNRRPATH